MGAPEGWELSTWVAAPLRQALPLGVFDAPPDLPLWCSQESSDHRIHDAWAGVSSWPLLSFLVKALLKQVAAE